MPTVESVMASKSGPAIASAQAGQVTVQRGTYELTATQAEDNTLVIRAVKLPAQHRFVQCILENDDLDSGATAELDVGLEDTIQDPADTTDSQLIAAGVSGQGAAAAVLVSQAALELPAVNYDRYITVAVATAATTGLAGGVAVTLFSRPELGSQFE